MLLMLICPITALASTVTVGPIACNYTHIWEALDAANPGDTIQVQNGTYYENLIIDKPITLRGNNTIIDASGLRSPIVLVSDNITLEGLTIENSGDDDKDAGIRVMSNNNSIIYNIIHNNHYGIYLESSTMNNITGNNVNQNFNGGIYLEKSDNNTITNNHIYSHLNEVFRSGFHWMRDSIADAINLRESNGNIVLFNTLHHNNCGIRVTSSKENGVVGNLIYKNIVGIYADYMYDPTCSNIFTHNRLTNNIEYNAYDHVDCSKCNKYCNQWCFIYDNITIGNQYGDFDEPREGCRDSNDDGFCDFAYEIPGGKLIDKNPIASQLIEANTLPSNFTEGTVIGSWQGTVDNKETWTGIIEVPANITMLKIRLTWDDPINSLALILFNETGEAVDASIDEDYESVEVFSHEVDMKVINPVPGGSSGKYFWRAYVYGYYVFQGAQSFELKAYVV
ncbi:MAG TPA: right-handed parallel beta-helix repeat-containing protein [Methanothrix sp.]|nr:right-handed parallel beta-helix repeat-containing protein [Methanothrix sp.]HPR65649.1 right-handed parallel beta-helix repeat-containing protein [Methanothrix sp.]